MAPQDPARDLSDAEENYHESSDEDFNPVPVSAEESSSSSSDEDTAAKPAHRKQKRKAPSPTDLDSGDEVTIEAVRKRRAKKNKKDTKGEDDDLLFSDDEGGAGGLIKTRAQRRVEQKERRPLARTEGATVDVDALWAQMSSAPLKPIYHTSQSIANEAGPSKVQDVAMGDVDAQGHADNETELVTVKRIYSFAGQRTTEERQVPRVSLFQYLSDGWKAVEPRAQESGDADSKVDGADAEDAQSKVRRPLRRPSRFDPNPTGQVRGLPPEYQLTWPRKITAMVQVDQENVPAPATPAVLRLEKAQKLNVVDKSRLDWTGYVDKEGIAEELDEHGKAKEAYLGRMEFLAGVEARREEERRRFKNLAAS